MYHFLYHLGIYHAPLNILRKPITQPKQKILLLVSSWASCLGAVISHIIFARKAWYLCAPHRTQLETINKYNKHSRQIGTENMHPWKEKNMNTQCPPFVQFARENASGYQFIGKWLSFSKVKKFMTLWTKKKTDTGLTNHVNNTIITKTGASSQQSHHLFLVLPYLIA